MDCKQSRGGAGGGGVGEGATHHFFQHLIRSFWEKGKARSLIIKTIRENLSNGSQETFFFSGLRNACASFGHRRLRSKREVCDNLVTTCHASPESNDDGIENSKRAIGLDWQKQQLCTCITLFYTFLCRRCSTAT